MSEPVIITDHLIKAGERTVNGRLYTQEQLEEMAASMQGKIEKRQLIGQIGQAAVDDDWRTKMAKASHLVTELSVKDGRMVASIEVLKTPEGVKLEQMLDAFKPEGMTLFPLMMGIPQPDGTVEGLRLDRIDILPRSYGL